MPATVVAWHRAARAMLPGPKQDAASGTPLQTLDSLLHAAVHSPQTHSPLAHSAPLVHRLSQPASGAGPSTSPQPASLLHSAFASSTNSVGSAHSAQAAQRLRDANAAPLRLAMRAGSLRLFIERFPFRRLAERRAQPDRPRLARSQAASTPFRHLGTNASEARNRLSEPDERAAVYWISRDELSLSKPACSRAGRSFDRRRPCSPTYS